MSQDSEKNDRIEGNAYRLRVAIVGKGNVGTHLARALGQRCDVTQVSSRSLERIEAPYDIILLAVSDRAIAEVASRILRSDYAVLAHTSGSIPLSAISVIHGRCGVFYPLQTFSRDSYLDYSQIPVFVEGSSPVEKELLMRLAGCFSEKVFEADSEARRQLHLASVFACNFTNHMYAIASKLLRENGLPCEALAPLIAETAAKASRMDPEQAQTGPAARGDTEVVEKHISILEDSPLLQRIYSDISESIMGGAR